MGLEPNDAGAAGRCGIAAARSPVGLLPTLTCGNEPAPAVWLPGCGGDDGERCWGLLAVGWWAGDTMWARAPCHASADGPAEDQPNSS